MNEIDPTNEFRSKLFGLIKRFIEVDGLRFNVNLPHVQLHREMTSDSCIENMTQDYAKYFWFKDPMNYSQFEDTDTSVITNSAMMSNFQWEKTEIYNEFFKPNGFFHNADMFFRQDNRIVAILSMLRKNAEHAFCDKEIELLKKLQPFVEFSLKKSCLSKRIHDRNSLTEKYNFTARELDVVELTLTGVSNKILSQKLKLSLPTLRTHLQNIYAKVGVHSNGELMYVLHSILK